MKLIDCGRSLCAALLIASVAVAAEPKATVVLDGLNNPSGIAIQPETGAIFVSDSAALRVIRVSEEGKAEDVITGFTQDIYGKGPMYNIGPLGLAFVDKDTLVVGDGGKKDGEELLRIYKLPADGSVMNADDMVASFNMPGTDELKPEGNFYAIVAAKTGIFVSSNGDDTKGWITRAQVKSDGFGPYERFIATKEAVGVDAPVGLTMDNRGNLVVGQMGEVNVPGDSLLSFYNAKNGQLLANFPTGLHDIASLAYHPKSGKLYAVDFAWMDATQGGLFELIVKDKADKNATAKKILSLDKPSAMAFGNDGALYVTVFGTAKEGEDTPSGQLLKIEVE